MWRTPTIRTTDHWFESLNAICDVVDAHQWSVPTSVQTTFRSHVDNGLSHYSWLAKDAAKNGKLQWSIVPKHHFLKHLPDMAKHLAPRAAWTYPGESMVGIITSLAQACTSSTSALMLTKPLMAKYRIAMHLRHTMSFNPPDWCIMYIIIYWLQIWIIWLYIDYTLYNQ